MQGLLIFFLCLSVISCSFEETQCTPEHIDISLDYFFMGRNAHKLFPEIREWDFSENDEYYVFNIKNMTKKNISIECREYNHLIGFGTVREFIATSDTLERHWSHIGSNLNRSRILLKPQDSVNLVSYTIFHKKYKGTTHVELPFNFHTDNDSLIEIKKIFDLRNLKELL